MSRIAIAFVSFYFLFSAFALAQSDTQEKPKEQQQKIQEQEKLQQAVENLDKPLYSAFIERYVLDELKQLRIDQAKAKNELLQQILDREHNSVDRGVAYATDTVTYFFYLIAAATSVLVLIGWTSMRDIKERVHSVANEQISKIISEYEQRLALIEKQLKQKTRHIEQNRDEIELTQEVQSLWLRAQQDSLPANKISIYDDILKLRPDDSEALAYKADAVLELNEPQWAVNLCHQILKKDPENAHAFYQLACAYTSMDQLDEALHYLAESLTREESYMASVLEDPALQPLIKDERFKDLSSLTNKVIPVPNT
jgi:tetratricopeptide (TPR) repeat protein